LLSGCGTILYPERRGQRAGTLDCGVILLDGLGLLLFFVPGIIAFAVDFATGAIYLPAGESQFFSETPARPQFQTLSQPTSRLSRAEIAQAVSQHTGQVIRLDDGQYHSTELDNIDHFWPALERLRSAHGAENIAASAG